MNLPQVYYTDGSGWNGKISEYAVTDHNGKIIVKKTLLKEYTSNEMEYDAVIYALQIAKDGDTIYSDSQLVVNQINKKWKLKAKNLFARFNYAKELYEKKNVKLIWLPREENLAGKIFE